MKIESKAQVLYGPRRLQLEEISVELPAEGGLLEVEACGLCGTDHEQYTGALPGAYPFIPGHEIVGIVREISPDAADRLGVTEGMRVAVDIFQSCRSCKACDAGDYRSCAKHGLADTYGFISTKKPPSLWGGYARYVYLTPDSVLHTIPDGLDSVVATLFNPLGAGIRWGVKVPKLEEGETVVILGPGIRGISALAASKSAGAGFVMVTGKGAKDAPRLEVAERFGADAVVDVEREDPVRILKKKSGGLANVVVDVTAKAPAALAQAVALAAPGGRIVLAGTKGSTETPGFVPDMVIYKELSILGALGVDSSSYKEALELLASKKFAFDDIPREVVPLEDAERILQKMGGESEEPPPLHAAIAPAAH